MERSPVSNNSISKRIMHLKIGNVSLKKIKIVNTNPSKEHRKISVSHTVDAMYKYMSVYRVGEKQNKTKPQNILIVLKKLRNTNKSTYKVYQININIQRTIFHFNLFMIHVCFEKVLFYIPETVVLERTFF